MSIWEWIAEFEWKAIQNGDTERVRILDIFQAAMQSMQSDPDRTLAVLEQGRALAQQLNEPWWVLFYDHWKLQTLIFHKRDYKTALDLAVRSAVETRKPQYAAFPQRVCLHEDLIYTYMGIDPLGHAPLIENALNYMESEMHPEVECRHCLQELRHEFLLACDKTNEAFEAALRALAMAQTEDDTHHQTYAYATLCKIAAMRGLWAPLLELSQFGEECARQQKLNDMLSELLLWQALAQRHLGEQSAAERLYRIAVAIMSRLGSVPRPGYFDALCAYHEANGDFQQALEVRQKEYKAIDGKGQPHAECQCLLKRCRLLADMGQPLHDTLNAARKAASRLIDPTPVVSEIEQIGKGRSN